MAGQIKVDSINADSNLALKIANTTVAFIDSSGLRPTSGNVNLDATATSKLYLPSANTVAIQTAGVTAVTVDSSQNVGIGTASPVNFGANTHSLTLDGTGLYNGVAWKSNGTTVALGYTNSTAGFILGTEGAIPLSLATNGTNQASITAAGLLQFNSGYGSVATAYGCRAWVNFNGTGTVAIRASGNVSSITDNGTGDYTVNFTTSMPDVNYAYSHSYSNEVNVQHTIGFLSSLLSSSLRVSHYNAANSANTADKSYVFIAIFR